MRSRTYLKRRVIALLPALALAFALPVAAAGAHGHARVQLAPNWHHGFYADDAIVSGTVTKLGSGSFSANAYVLVPGPGNSGTAPSATAATILTGSSTKVIAYGQQGITVGDDFYAIYKGVSSSTSLSTLETDTPAVVYAFAPPTPEVEVKGVITTAPASGSDQFTATAYVVTPPTLHPGGGGWGQPRPAYHGPAPSFGYSYGGGIGGGYGFAPPASRRGYAKARCLPGSTPVSDGTSGTLITTDSATKFLVNGRSATISSLAKGDTFTAIFDGTPSEPLATITATPAISVSAHTPPTPNALYAFVGTVTAKTSTSVTVDVTSSTPSGLFTGADTFTVGPTTMVFGNSTSSLFGSISSVSAGDVVAGGLIGGGGQTASAVEADPLQVLVDFPTASSSSSSSSSSPAIKRAEKRALKLLRAEKRKLERQHEKHGKKK